jgi:hypothetical protein
MAKLATGQVQERYADHLVFDGLSPTPGSPGFNASVPDNLFGRASGLGGIHAGQQASSLSDANLTGAGVTYGATTVDDPSKTWVTGQWGPTPGASLGAGNNPPVGLGAKVTSISANGVTEMIVTSNDDDTLTGTAGWSNGQPANGAPYTVNHDGAIEQQGGGAGVTYTATTLDDSNKSWGASQWIGFQVTSVGTGGAPTFLIATASDDDTVTGAAGWTNGTPAGGAVYSIKSLGPKQRDNWYAEKAFNGNANNL